jgi:hypothetical protein
MQTSIGGHIATKNAKSENCSAGKPYSNPIDVYGRKESATAASANAPLRRVPALVKTLRTSQSLPCSRRSTGRQRCRLF